MIILCSVRRLTQRQLLGFNRDADYLSDELLQLDDQVLADVLGTLLEFETELRDLSRVKFQVSAACEHQLQQIIVDKYNLASALLSRIALSNKFSDFEVNKFMHAMQLELDSHCILHLRPSCILLIKNKYLLVKIAETAELQLQLLVLD